MDKFMINLRGRAKAGKSTSLKQLGYLLTGEQCSDYEIKKVFDYRGVKVGIVSLGDTQKLLEPGLNELIDSQCDIIACASRTKGGPAKCVDAAAKKHGYTKINMGPIFSYKYKEICNNQLSMALKELIDRLIDNS